MLPIIQIIQISGGSNHLIAMAADGTVYGAGYNAFGQLGDNSSTNRTTPIKTVKGLYNGMAYLGDNPSNPINAVSAGGNHTLTIAEDGTLYGFGYNGLAIGRWIIS